jgi:anthranilate/para-aminobenzoate synthase component I
VTDGEVVETWEGNPLDFIAAYQKRFKPGAAAQGLPRFCGGLAGYFGYDTVRFIEPKLAQRVSKPGGIGTPDIMLLQTEELAVIDNLSGRLYLIVYADPGRPEAYFQGKKARRADGQAAQQRHRAAGQAPTESTGGARVRAGRIRSGGAQEQGVHRRRRLHAGRHRPAPARSATPRAR